MSTDSRTKVSTLLDVAPYAVMIGVLIVFYLAPYNLLRGESDSLWEFAAALLGCGFWIACTAALAGTL
jgi:hypothetical protein